MLELEKKNEFFSFCWNLVITSTSIHKQQKEKKKKKQGEKKKKEFYLPLY